MNTLPTPQPQPGDAAVEAHPTHGIGERLARLRVKRGVKVSQLARVVGVSPSLISQIERGQSRPSVSTLFELAQALDVPVDAFFRDADAVPATATAPATAPAAPPPEPAAAEPAPLPRPVTAMPERPVPVPDRPRHRYLVRADARDVIEIEGGVRWESLTPRPLDELEFLELVYEGGGESSPRLYRHPGTEMVMVLSGRLDIHVGFERYELGPGDSIHFPSSMPHRYVNPTDETARAVTVILRDEHPDAPPHTTRRP
jgi:transcriptional regulator with XRE-family HTH domain/quercetin dioxygenase-like cupin family protein